MRSWFFHPIIFYPLILILGALIVLVSLEPQKWPHKPAPVGSQHDGASLVWTGAGFDAPDTGPDQRVAVQRDFWGRAETLHVAVLPNQPAPTSAEQGVRILLTPADAAAVAGRPVTVEISYHPLPINAATGLAVSLQGGAPAQWVTHDAPSPPQGALKFELPAQTAANAIGLRVISTGTDEAYGLEITRIKVTPHA
jgi:hypothetical protein